MSTALLNKEISTASMNAALKEMKDAFELFDVDKSNTIDASELENVMRTIGIHPTREELARYIAHADSDGDGVISFQEFAALIRECKKTQGDADLRTAFEYYDATGEGVVTATELHRQLSKLGMDISLSDCETMIKAASSDVDNRGRPQVTLEQLQTYLGN